MSGSRVGACTRSRTRTRPMSFGSTAWWRTCRSSAKPSDARPASRCGARMHAGCGDPLEARLLNVETEKPPSCVTSGGPIFMLVLYLRPADVLGLQAFGTTLYLELHLRALLERPITVHLNGREVHEHIIAVRALNEAIALRGVKPFHNTFFSHY